GRERRPPPWNVGCPRDRRLRQSASPRLADVGCHARSGLRHAPLLVVGIAFVISSCSGGPVPARTPSPSTTPRGNLSPGRSSPTLLAVPKPPIVSKPIPFPPWRRDEMAAYAKRHYGLDTPLLRHPQAVVEHFTATDTFQVAWNTFASDAPDLGELPGTCSH